MENRITQKESGFEYSKNEQELIEILLGIRDNPYRKSTLQLALESARFHCGIDKSGRIDNATFEYRQDFVDRIIVDKYKHYISDEADIFSALLSYFICLEQIGTLFYTEKRMKDGESNGIINAIILFSSDTLTKEKRIALKNLRNSLGHAYGLVNLDKSRNSCTHKYILDFKNESENVIVVPNKKNKWDGNFLNKKEESSTVVYVFPLIRFIEKIISNVIDEYNKGTLRFIFYEEIKSRFTIAINNN